MYKIILTESWYTKNPNTKTSYVLDEQEVKEVTDKQHYLATNENTLKAFRRAGGSETAVKSYTIAGYKVTKLTSTSKDKFRKVVREYKFEEITPKEERELNEFQLKELEERAFDDSLAERQYLENR